METATTSQATAATWPNEIDAPCVVADRHARAKIFECRRRLFRSRREGGDAEYLVAAIARWARIGTIRDATKVSPVRLHRVPAWLHRRIVATFGRERGANRMETLRRAARLCGGEGWLDHAGVTRLTDGRLVFVSEPYGIDGDALAAAESIARTVGCDCRLTADSWWAPPQTVRIILAEPAGRMEATA